MLFSENLPLAIYIKKNSLGFYFNQKEEYLEFSSDTVKDTDIINPNQYEKLVQDFLVTNNLKRQKALLVLSEGIVFQKIIPFTDIKMLEEEFANFVEMVPIESENLRKKYVKIDGNIYLFAINKWLIEKLIEILKKLNWDIMTVVPLTLFTDEDILNVELIKKIISNKQLIKKADFLTDASPVISSSGINKKILIFLLILLLIIIFLSGALLIRNYFINKNKLAQSLSKTLPPLSTATDSANPKIATQPATLSKGQLSVTVLNGTGIAGQATKVKNLLIELGLTKIETDNAEGANAEDTVVIFSSGVPDSLQEEVINLLKERFDNVSTQKNISSPSADILITTGKPKASSQESP